MTECLKLIELCQALYDVRRKERNEAFVPFHNVSVIEYEHYNSHTYTKRLQNKKKNPLACFVALCECEASI